MARTWTGPETWPETLPNALDAPQAKWAQRARRLGALALASLVLAGATGLLGVRTSTVTATGSGYTASFTFARIARPGWDVPWRLTVKNPGGFAEPVTVAVTADSFLIYESQRFFPEPSEETRDAERIYLTFEPPPGETLVIDYDAYIQPSAQRGRDVQIEVITGGLPRVSLRASTILVP